MKKAVILPLLVVSLLLGGCKTTPKKKTSKESSIHSETTSREGDSSSQIALSSGTSLTTQIPPSSSSSGTSSSSSEIDPPGGEVFEGIFIRWYPETVKVSSTKSSAPIVDVVYAEGHSGEEFDNPLTWDTSDHSIAEADQYGRITAKQKGIVTLTCTTIVDNLSASCRIVCYNNDSDFNKTWNRLGASDNLQSGDQLIIACPEFNKAATTESTGSYLHATSVTYNSDKSQITDASGAAKFILGEDYRGREGYNLEVPELDEPYLAFTNEAKIHWENQPKKSNTLWYISFDLDNNVWDMRTVTIGDGWMMYNHDKDGFAPYQSSETEMMKVMTLYRLTYTLK